MKRNNPVEYGPEGIPSYFEANQSVTFAALCDAVQACATVIDTSEGNGWVTKLEIPALIEHSLGTQESYDVRSARNIIEKIGTEHMTHEEMLLHRALTLLSFDLLNPASVATIDPLLAYEDLHLTEPALQPIGTFSRGEYEGSERDLTFNLFDDGNRRIKIHVYGYGAQENTLDDGPHEHYGRCGSLILHGGLINEHMELREALDGETPDYDVYEMKDAPTPPTRKIFEKQFSGVSVPVSSHCYNAGDHYYLPAKNGHIEGEPKRANEQLYLHTASGKPNTVTLFAQDISDKTSLITTRPHGFGANIIEKETADIRHELSRDETTEAFASLDEAIKASLSQCQRPSTILNRPYGYGTVSESVSREQGMTT